MRFTEEEKVLMKKKAGLDEQIKMRKLQDASVSEEAHKAIFCRETETTEV